jgi:hypothetical protein
VIDSSSEPRGFSGVDPRQAIAVVRIGNLRLSDNGARGSPDAAHSSVATETSGTEQLRGCI